MALLSVHLREVVRVCGLSETVLRVGHLKDKGIKVSMLPNGDVLVEKPRDDVDPVAVIPVHLVASYHYDSVPESSGAVGANRQQASQDSKSGNIMSKLSR
jgi:hypothetical protein